MSSGISNSDNFMTEWIAVSGNEWQILNPIFLFGYDRFSGIPQFTLMEFLRLNVRKRFGYELNTPNIVF